ncbi:MAG: hypothetical protein COY47_03295 [Chloroflexi bacterium CG_4_10_14_0_8_um_filter_57_5]|nr:MAG: hypothetical protein COY47_03295 [Chloroflexi bacterium CG_4_10_14_0_8_um_filter_57_5]
MVANLVRLADRCQVADAAIRTHCGERLVFGTAIERVNLVWTFLDLDDALAAHDAGVAGIAALAILFALRRAG